ncbi:MAG: hypothetical protein DWB56_11815, partial [Candidatus Jettenia sp.]|uniref:hypothetical protein n=1 Tax=Candidatus Jettenia sp. AMX1 TaxID=2293637 RepID=UPI002553D3A8
FILIYLSYKIIYGTLSLILLVYQIFIRLCATKPLQIMKFSGVGFAKVAFHDIIIMECGEC